MGNGHEQEIGRHRAEIDRIDRELLRLLNRRAGEAIALGAIKRALGRPVYDPAREREVVEQVRRANEGPLADEAVARVFERIIDESRRIERTAAHEEPEETP